MFVGFHCDFLLFSTAPFFSFFCIVGLEKDKKLENRVDIFFPRAVRVRVIHAR